MSNPFEDTDNDYTTFIRAQQFMRLAVAARQNDVAELIRLLDLGANPHASNGYVFRAALIDNQDWLPGSAVEVLSDRMFGPGVFQQLCVMRDLGHDVDEIMEFAHSQPRPVTLKSMTGVTIPDDIDSV